MTKHLLFLMCVVISSVSAAGAAVNLLSPQKDIPMLIVPARPAVLQMAFDLARMRAITIVSFRAKAADEPLLHVWTGSEWQYVGFDDFCAWQFINPPPKTIILIGDDQTVPKALIQGISQAGRIERLPTMNVADIINGLNPHFKFNPREWKKLADSYGLNLQAANTPQAKRLEKENAVRPVPAEKSGAAVAKAAEPPVKMDNRPPAAKERSNQTPEVVSEEPCGKPQGILILGRATASLAELPGRRSGIGGQAGRAAAGRDALALPRHSSLWQVYPPEAAPQATRATGYSAVYFDKFYLHLGEDTDISFIWIAPLSIWVSQYETTNDQYRRFDRAHDPKRYYDHILDLPDQPVVLVSWEDANNYCGWLNRNFRGQLPQGFECRLPTEKEWNVFAAGGREAKYPWGDQWPPPDAFNYKGMEGAGLFYGIFHNEKFIRGHNDGFIVTAPADKSGRNEWGLYGVGGNAWEWCQDWFDDTKTARVLKGAAWNNYEPEILMISNRSAALLEKSNAMIGFRVVIAPHPARAAPRGSTAR